MTLLQGVGNLLEQVQVLQKIISMLPACPSGAQPAALGALPHFL